MLKIKVRLLFGRTTNPLGDLSVEDYASPFHRKLGVKNVSE